MLFFFFWNSFSLIEFSFERCSFAPRNLQMARAEEQREITKRGQLTNTFSTKTEREFGSRLFCGTFFLRHQQMARKKKKKKRSLNEREAKSKMKNPLILAGLDQEASAFCACTGCNRIFHARTKNPRMRGFGSPSSSKFRAAEQSTYAETQQLESLQAKNEILVWKQTLPSLFQGEMPTCTREQKKPLKTSSDTPPERGW